MVAFNMHHSSSNVSYETGTELPQDHQTNGRLSGFSESSTLCESECCSEASSIQGMNHHRLVTLLVIVILFVVNQACRALPFYVVDFSQHGNEYTAMNKSLHFGTGRYGVLATMGFTVPFFLGSFAGGVIADKMDRVRISMFAGIVWSACTFCTAFATSYWQVLGLRALVGLSQSVTNPAAISLIGEDFPEARATVASVFGLGIYVGGGLANVAVGVDSHIGWRTTSSVFGVGSFLVSLSALLARDPHRQHQAECTGSKQSTLLVSEGDEKGYSQTSPQTIGMLTTVRHWFANGASLMGQIIEKNRQACESNAAKWLLMAALCRFCAGFGIMVWLATAIKLRHPDHLAAFAVCNTLIKVFAGGSASLAGGVIADLLKHYSWGVRSTPLFCAFFSGAAAPLWCMVLQENIAFGKSMLWLLVQYLVAETWLGPAIATLQNAVPLEHRGAAQGVFTAMTALGNLVPACLGLFGPETIVHGLQASVATSYLLSAGCFCAAAVCMPCNEAEDTTVHRSNSAVWSRSSSRSFCSSVQSEATSSPSFRGCSSF